MVARKTAVDYLRELFDFRLAAIAEALKLQATEYERRLELLNNEADRIAQAASKAVSLEKFEGYVAAQQVHNETTQAFITSYNTTMSELRREQSRLRSTMTLLIAGLALLVSVIVVILRIVA